LERPFKTSVMSRDRSPNRVGSTQLKDGWQAAALARSATLHDACLHRYSRQALNGYNVSINVWAVNKP
jgi:hypothetical protein